MLVLLGGALHSRAQTVPLGNAAAYGLLSQGTITAANAVPGAAPVNIPIQVLGKAGDGQAIGALVAGSGGTFAQSSGTVPAALADLQTARDYCHNLAGSGPLTPQLGGQTLGGGVYGIGGNATLGSNSALTLTGDTSTVIVLNIDNDLEAQAGSRVVLDGVSFRHVYWNVGGRLMLGSQVSFAGVALMSGPARVDGIQLGACALLSQQDIDLTHVSATMGHNRYYSAQNYGGGLCAQPAPCVAPAPSSELILNGNFDLMACCPTTFGGLLLGPGAAPPSSDGCFWQSPTAGTADYLNSCSTTRYSGHPSVNLVSVPNNFAAYTTTTAGASPFRRRGGGRQRPGSRPPPQPRRGLRRHFCLHSQPKPFLL